MKKIFAALLTVCCFAVLLAGCGLSDPLVQNSNTETTTQAAATKDETPAVKDTDYKDDFNGLCDYFVAMGYTVANVNDKLDEKNVTEMDASLIGAENGKKFVTSYNGKSITIELYSYDTSKLNDTANQIIESVKKDGKFTILDLSPVTAYLSDNGKYLMVYSDASIDENKKDDANYTHREQVINDFKAFHSVS